MPNKKKSKELYNLSCEASFCDPNRFQKIKRWMDKNKNTQLLIKAANYRDKKKNFTTLHYLVMKKPPADLVERLLTLKYRFLNTLS